MNEEHTNKAQQDYVEKQRYFEESKKRDNYYTDVRKIRKIAQYFLYLSIISIVVWLILLLS